MNHKWIIKFIGLITLYFISSGLEVLTLSLILPFINSVVAGNFFVVYLNIELSLNIVFNLIVLIVLTHYFLKIYVLYFTADFSYNYSGQIMKNLYEAILKKDYSWFVGVNTSDIINNITLKAFSLGQKFILPTVSLFSSTLVAVSIIVYLLYTTFFVTIFLVSSIISMYFIATCIFRPKVVESTYMYQNNNSTLISHIKDTISNIREIIIGDHQKFYFLKNNSITDNINNNAKKVDIFSALPRLFIEGTALLSILSLTYFIAYSNDFISINMGVLSILLIGILKLVPYFQQIYYGYISYKSNINTFYEIDNFIKDTVSIEYSDIFQFNEIYLNKVGFSYGEKVILKDFSLKIKIGDKVRISGISGSGKTTLINILSGLYLPSIGEVLLDNVQLTQSNVNSLRSVVSYVPQNYHIYSGSIVSNLALGINSNEVDLIWVSKILRIVGLEYYVNSNNTINNIYIAENGDNMSAGQKQRIIIGRALYSKPKILILDESTANLDLESEYSVLQKIFDLPDLTILFVSHRNNMLNFNKNVNMMCV